MKTCTKCKISKETVEFNRDKSRKDNRFPWCKRCSNQDQRDKKTANPIYLERLRQKYALTHPPRPPIVIDGMKKCTKCQQIKKLDLFHKEKSAKSGRQNKCKPCRKEQSQKRNSTPEAKAKNKINKQKIYADEERLQKAHRQSREYNKRPNVRNKKCEDARKRRIEDQEFRLKGILRCRFRKALKAAGTPKIDKALDILGCTPEQAWLHLESTFSKTPCPITGEMMTRENHGRIWHIDHKQPCDSFDLTDPEQQKICFHWTNLQALFVKENLKKSNRSDWVRA